MSNADDFVVENGILTEYNGEDTELVIPDCVTGIADKVFEDRSDICSVIVPEGVTEIGENTFAWCYGLDCITLPNSLTQIRWSTFLGCEDLTIYAPKGSYAEAYATENEIKFVAK